MQLHGANSLTDYISEISLDQTGQKPAELDAVPHTLQETGFMLLDRYTADKQKCVE